MTSLASYSNANQNAPNPLIPFPSQSCYHILFCHYLRRQHFRGFPQLFLVVYSNSVAVEAWSMDLCNGDVTSFYTLLIFCK